MGGGERIAGVESETRRPRCRSCSNALMHRRRCRRRKRTCPLAPPEGLDRVLYEYDERAARADLRRQIAAIELQLARLFGSAFPCHRIEFGARGADRGR